MNKYSISLDKNKLLTSREVTDLNMSVLIINKSLSALGTPYDDVELDGITYRVRQRGKGYDVHKVIGNDLDMSLLPVTSKITKKVLKAYSELKKNGE